jgi:hypothetical protein
MWKALQWLARRAGLRDYVLKMFDEDEVTEVMVRPWTPVHSKRGKFVHMCHDGENTLCGVRLLLLVPVPDARVDCLQCHNALTFN